MGKIYSLIYSFHMPLFFIISGYTLNAKNDIKQFVQKKIRAFGPKYLIFSVLWTIYNLFFGSLIYDKSTVYNTLLITSKSFYSIYWFLPAIFMGELIVLIFIKKCRNTNMIIFFSLLSYITAICYKRIVDVPLPLCADAGLLSCLFITLGWLLRKCDLFERLGKKHCKIMMVMCLTLGSALFLICYIFLRFSPAYFSSVDIGNPVMFACIGVLLSFSVLLVSYLYESRLEFFKFFGKNSLILYMIHYFFLPLK